MTTSLRLATAVGCLFSLGLIACGANDTGTGGSSGGRPGTGGSSGGSGFGGSGFGGSGFGGNGFGGAGGGSGGGVGGGVGGAGGGVGGVGGGVGGVGGGVGGVGGGVGGVGGGVGGVGGGVGGGSGGVGGGVGGTGGTGGGGLTDCDGRNESSKAPITQACGSFITPYPQGTGTKIQMGPLGARMDVNVGAGFETTCSDDTGTCPGFVGLFDPAPNEPMTNQLLDVGPQPCNASTPNSGNCLNFKLYSVYYPATWPSTPVPVLAWGNGTCAQPEGYGALLRYIASQGFFIVAANCREVGSGAQMRRGLDFAAAANTNSASPYYGHLDMSKAGIMGHSQGSSGTAAAASDSRVKAVILFNGGTSASKPFAVFTGDGDISATTPSALQTAVNGASKGAFFYYNNPVGAPTFGITGHLVLMLSPQRVTDQATSFWQAVLNNDAAARAKFTGTSCAFCGHTGDYSFGQKGM